MGITIQRMHDPDVLDVQNIGFVIEVDKGEPIIGLIRREYPRVWAKYQKWISKDTDEWSADERRVYWGRKGLVLDERLNDDLERIDGLMIYVRDGHALVKVVKDMYPKTFDELLDQERRGEA